MEKLIGSFSPQVYAVLRMIAGFMFAMHGTQKLFGWPGQKDPVDLNSLMGLAGIIEFVGGILIMIGLFASVAAFICSGQMAVAFFMVHAPQLWNPLLNGGELAVVYCFFFLYVSTKGAGIWSADAARHKKHSSYKYP